MANEPSPTKDLEMAPPLAPPERTPKLSDYLRVFTYATKWDFCIYVAAAVASIGAGITLPLMNVVFGRLVGQFTDYFRDATSLSSRDFNQVLNKQALYIMALFVVRWGLSSINKFCFRMIGIRLSSAIRHQYLKSLLAQSIHVIDSMPAGAPATAITTTSNTLQLGISERLGTFLQFMSTIIAALIVAFVWSWDLTLVTSSLIIYSMVVMAVVLPRIIKDQTAAILADAQGTAVASEALGGIRLVMACGAQSHVLDKYQEWVQTARKKAQGCAPVVGLEFGLLFFGVFGAFGLAFWYGTQRYYAGALSNAGVVIVVLMSVMMILTSVERVSTPMLAVSRAMVAACEFFSVIDAPAPESGSLKPDITGQDLIFQDVTFEYPSRPGVKVLDGLYLRIRSGQNTAIVGPSGSGKSTIVGLIERWYVLKEQPVLPKVVEAKAKPAKKSKSKLEKEDEKAGQPVEEVKVPLEPLGPKLSGSVSIGEHNVEGLDLHWWRAQIGLVQQEPFLFNDTIFANVANGLIGTSMVDETEERKRELVKEACQEAYAHEFISRLPEGYDTRVGDGGAKLSGGQKQRIAIARSIIKHPQIIILDEATSAIDAKSEHIVQAALDKITQNHTTITIAHRLSTIKKADHIVVLQSGQAVEEGTHESLIANPDGIYSGLVKAQSLHLAPGDEEAAEGPLLGSDADSEKKVLSTVSDAVASRSQAPTHQEAIDRKPLGVLPSFGKLIYEQRAQWPSYIGLILSSATVAAATPIQAWLFAKVLGVFLLTGHDLKSQSNFWGLMWFALAAGAGLAYFFMGWISLRLQYFVSSVYKTRYLTDMLYQKVRFFDEDANSHGTLSARISSDVKQLEELFGINLASGLSGVFTVVGCITIALIFGWKLGLVAMFVTMPIMLATGLWKFKHEVRFDQMNSAVFTESSKFATEAIGAIRTVASLTMEGTINDRYQKLLDGHVSAARSTAQWTAALYGFADSASLGCQALIFWYGGRMLASGEYTLEAFFVCFMAIIQGAEAAGQVLGVAPDAAQAAAAANRVFEIQSSADVPQATAKPKQGIPDPNGGIAIEFRGISFKYPTRDVQVYEDLSLSIEKGQYVAFVGPSGCGKTTLISLLERFYDLESDHGAILCNGVDINGLGVYDYRRYVSLVAQEPTLFKGTVRDNILFGVEDPSPVSDEQIQQVCRDAFIHDFITSLPEGYDTDVGSKGVSMSGGQKQRIAIARALIRDPKILLLDEATSALDSESEKVVQAAFEKAREGRTMIAVAHRLSTIQNADCIFVFDQGIVVEKGTHSELVQKKGVYWEMCQSQALDQ